MMTDTVNIGSVGVHSSERATPFRQRRIVTIHCSGAVVQSRFQNSFYHTPHRAPERHNVRIIS